MFTRVLVNSYLQTLLSMQICQFNYIQTSRKINSCIAHKSLLAHYFNCLILIAVQ